MPTVKPGNKKKHRAYLWAYAPGPFETTRAVVYDFHESRAGENTRAFLGKSDEDDVWSGPLVCDDCAAYLSLFTKGVTEFGCMAHAQRRSHSHGAGPSQTRQNHHSNLVAHRERNQRDL